MHKEIRDTIQDCHLNFLLGSGISSPFLSTLGNIETLLAELDHTDLAIGEKALIRASLYKTYFEGSLGDNVKILHDHLDCNEIYQSYCQFLQLLNTILLRRKSTILSKELNLFTTNVDIFLEKALEDLGLEYNDGFNGRFKPVFSLSHFKKSRFKNSLHYDNVSEIPVFNLLKLHGSLSWETDINNNVVFSCDLRAVTAVADRIPPPEDLIEMTAESTISSLAVAAKGAKPAKSLDVFMQAYDQLLIVNPTKEKFKHTILNQTYYELLRLYSNELEKENSVLFVMGFSFADEHIREITLRAANSNPTLMIYVIAHSSNTKTQLELKLASISIKNNNIKIVCPPQILLDDGAMQDEYNYNLSAVTQKLLGGILADINETPVAPEATLL